MRKIAFALAIVAMSWTATAQPASYSNLRAKRLPATGTVLLDSVSIVPNTFFVKQADSTFYVVDAVNALLRWIKNPGTDSVDVLYRVFPYKLNAAAQRFNYDSIVNQFKAEPFVFNRNRQTGSSGNLFDFGTMNYNGSFARALSFGNNQDVVVNSQFNLQLNGLIGDSIEVAAAITDNNIPLQPDGTTQQLNEFDRVWLQFKKRGWEANLGDIDIRQNQHYFLNFYKRVQGISYTMQTQRGAVNNNTTVSGAVAKGKFTRNILQGQEGNQGPYRLQGANNEFFFIVLAGTERVFIDGQLLQRGEDQDYTINYNTAELSFTPRRMITKDSRIQIEFEYADRNYLNSLLFAKTETSIGSKLKINLAAYSNADAKNSPINQPLDAAQRRFLNVLGDSIHRAFYPSAMPDSFEVGKILYAKIDTAFNGSRDSVFVFSTDKNLATYNLSFLEVGVGRGNYVPDFNAANGKVYKWVAPLNGQPQGNFEPALYLVTPKKLQVVAASTHYTINPKNKLETELALSHYDVNTFSVKDKVDNAGLAARIRYQGTIHWQATSGKKMALQTDAGYEYVHSNFKALERLRPVEFYRDWGMDFQPQAATEQLPSVKIQLADDAGNSLDYQLVNYLRSDGYRGIRNIATHRHQFGGIKMLNEFRLTQFQQPGSKGFFLRPTIDLQRTFEQMGNYAVGVNYQLEHNQVANNATDTLQALSFAFTNIAAYIKSNPAKDNRWALTWFTRINKIPVGTQLVPTDRSQNFNLSAELLSNKNHQVRTNVTFRQLHVINKSITNLQPENSLLGRAEYAVNEWKGFLNGNLLYELGAGQEQRRDFSYIEVPAGRGEYAWNDYNNDGIRQLNEFEVAVFQDQARYIRVFTPTNQFVKANYTQLNYAFTLNPRVLFAKHQKGIGNLLSRFNLQSSLQTARKMLSSGVVVFNPFKGAIADTSLVTLTSAMANTLTFNRFSSKWGADVSNVRNFNKALLTYGFESRILNEWIIKGRWNLNKNYTVEYIHKAGTSQLATPSFANRNYRLATASYEPRFTYTRGTTFRVVSSYQFNSKANQAAFGGEVARTHSLNIESKYNAVNNTSLNGKFTYSNIHYTGTVNSTVSYIMLDALLPGKNYLWTIDLTKRLGNSLELNFQYEGRQPGQTRTIHTGRASLRALL